MARNVPNQRATGRVQPNKPRVRIHGLQEQSVPAVVLDESFGGLGIAAPVSRIEEGAELDVELSIDSSGVRSLAVVRHQASLPSGSRLGIEWKAQALSRQLRDLLIADSRDANHSLARILPGGLSTMWKLFEASRWQHLIASADRLKKESAAAQTTSLLRPIEQFQLAVHQHLGHEADAAAVSAVRAELDELIEQCIAAIG